MPLGEIVGEFTLKVTSVNYSPAGGEMTKAEVNVAAEISGRLSGRGFGTLTIEGVPGLTRRWAYAGATFTSAGARIEISGQGVLVPTGTGPRGRARGTATYRSTAPELSWLNGFVGAVEFEADPTAEVIKGAVCEWK
jgi:hypothetical protein